MYMSKHYMYIASDEDICLFQELLLWIEQEKYYNLTFCSVMIHAY